MIFGISYLHSCCIATLILVLNWIDIVNEAIKTISNQFFFLFFFMKRFWAYKNANQTKTNQQKHKQVNKKQ